MSIQWPPYADGQYHFGTQANSFVVGVSGDGVVTGLTLSEDSPLSMDVVVASGKAIVNGSPQNNAGGDVTLTSDGTYDRWTLIWINSSNTLGKTEGTPAANPAMPDYPANAVVLGAVLVPQGATTISNTNIKYRARIVLDDSFRDSTDPTKVAVSALASGIEKYFQAYANGEISSSTQDWVDISGMTTGSKTFSGNPCLIMFTCEICHKDGDEYCQDDVSLLRILYDSTPIYETTQHTLRMNDSYGHQNVCMARLYTPGSGSHTIKVQAKYLYQTGGNYGWYIYDRSLVVIELEKASSL